MARGMTKQQKIELIQKTSWLEDGSAPIMREYCLGNGIGSYREIPKCPICNATLTWDLSARRFKIFCSRECQTSKAGYALQTEKNEETMLRKYGVRHSLQFKEFKSKMDSTILAKFGTTNVSKLDTIKKQKEETTLKNYGVTHTLKIPEFLEHIKARVTDKYGAPFYLQSKEGKDLLRDIIRERHGVDHIGQVEGASDKASMTKRRTSYSTIKENLAKKGVTLLDDIKEFTDSKEHTYRCLLCGIEFKSGAGGVQRVHCPNTDHHPRSIQEAELLNWVRGLRVTEVIPNERFRYNQYNWHELDVYLPELNLGIEYHGLYWHAERSKGRTYHRDKYKFFDNLGIQVIQIFENEWRDVPHIVKSIILNLLHKQRVRIYARKCIVEEISPSVYRDFLKVHHLQGYCRSSVKLGLYYEGTLVAVQSFSGLRFKDKEDGSYEMIRFCQGVGTSVIGGFSKLLKYFERTYSPKRIESYIDLRYFSGEGYKKNGFHVSGVTKPNYYYFKNNDKILYSRMRFQKHKLSGLLEKFDSTQTEYENMVANGYYRIFDAGNLLMIKNYEGT